MDRAVAALDQPRGAELHPRPLRPAKGIISIFLKKTQQTLENELLGSGKTAQTVLTELAYSM